MIEGQTCISESLWSYLRLITHHRQDLRAQLSQECNVVRHVTLQKDIDLKDLQTWLDRTVSTTFMKIILSTYALQTGQLSQARESLVVAETSKVHLQERVEQLRMIYSSLPASSPNCNAHWKKSDWLRMKIRRRWRISFLP